MDGSFACRSKTSSSPSSICIINQLFLWVNFCLPFLLLHKNLFTSLFLLHLPWQRIVIICIPSSSSCARLAVSHSRKSFFFGFVHSPTFHLCDIIFLRKLKEVLDDWGEFLASRNYANCFCDSTRRSREIFCLSESHATALKIQPAETGKQFCTPWKHFAHKVAARFGIWNEIQFLLYSLFIYIVFGTFRLIPLHVAIKLKFAR